ncbi:GH3 auxin-responsive promoter [Pelagophyceae sp. CCMP2097]|nr:GH3 auxin-responsive promoter [Pelagophyceae sp. CCMP2097]
MLRRGAQAGAAAAGAVVLVQAARFASKDRSDCHTASSALQQFVIFDLLRVAGAVARRSHDKDCAAFEATQAALLRRRLEAARDTSYGRAHDFAALLAAGDDAAVVASFRAAQPLTAYDDYAPYVDRIAGGEANVLNAEPETMLAATSGTSSRRALLPNTKDMSGTFFARGILVLFDTLANQTQSLDHLQRTCKLAFAPRWSTTAGGLRVGPNSSGPKDPSFEKMRAVLYSSPRAAYDVDGELEALHVHALFAARDRKLGILEANFITMPARLLSLLNSSDGEVIADEVERGALAADVAAKLPPHLVDEINALLQPPDTARAAEIRAAIRGGAAGAPSFALRLWPEMRLILSNATGAFQPYARKLHAADTGLAVGVPIYSTVLAASEGLIGISLDPKPDGTATYCLVPRAMFFEFKHDDRPEPFLAHELKARPRDTDYELVVTNLGGLWRYRIGDVVRVVGFHGEAPLVEFRYRKGQVLNVRGEKTSERHLQAAVAEALPGCGDFAAVEASIESTRPRYEVFVEQDAAWPVGAAARLDAALRAENAVYGAWRDRCAIEAPTVVRLRSGAFDALRALRLAEGASAQQLKTSRVLRTPEHAALLASFRAEEPR